MREDSPGSAAPSKIEQAEAALRERKFAQAESISRAILKAEPNSRRALQSLAFVLGQTGRHAEALDLLERILSTEPSDFEALNWRASLLRETGRLPEAIDSAVGAVRSNPSSATGHFTLGLCYLAGARNQEAASEFETAASLRPSFPSYRFHLGVAFERVGAIDSAASAYRQAIAVDSTFLLAHVNFAQLLERQGRSQEALEQYSEALNIQPTAGGFVRFAELAMKLERMAEAEEAARSAVRLDPKLVVAHELLGNILEEMGRFPEAVASFERVLSLKPDRASLHYKLARSKKFSAEDQPFIDRLKAQSASPSVPPDQSRYLHYALGKVDDDLGLYEEAMAHFDEANRLSRHIQFGSKIYPREQVRQTFEAISCGFTKELFSRDLGASSDSELPVFIVGMIRSGTTLVEQVLSSHPDIGAAGELPFWLGADANELLRSGTAGNLNRQLAQELGSRYLEDVAALVAGKARVTDKMPNNYMVLGLLHLVFPNARIIHCRRQPVDNCLSIYQTVYSEPPAFVYDKENIVFAYRQYEGLMEHWGKTLPSDQLLEVNYEELVRNPEVVARTMVAFVGLPWDEACLRPDRNPRRVKTPSLWQVRQPVYLSSIARWRNYLSCLGAFQDLLPTEPAD